MSHAISFPRYARLLERDEASAQLLSQTQLQNLISQLRKVCNHPKILLLAANSRGLSGGSFAASALGIDGDDEDDDSDTEPEERERQRAARRAEKLRRAAEATAELTVLKGEPVVPASG